jgi:hypothetical protein
MEMKISRKQIAGFAALLVAAAYSFFRWSDTSDDAGGQAPTSDHRTPDAD